MPPEKKSIYYTPAEIRDKIREVVRKKHKSQRKAAIAWGVSEQFLSAVLKGKREPSRKILLGVGARKTSFTRYVIDEQIEGIETGL
jgi:hypothetical protein